MSEVNKDAASMIARLKEEVRRSSAQLHEVERMGQIGSYDWEIASDTNRWSDELYLLYGAEPQSFNPSYARFMEFVHPDDRDNVSKVHREALASGSPYSMEERIVRPDGEVRILSTAGEVVLGDDGQPVRMVGVCMDVTDHRRAQAESLDAARRFQALLDSSPDAVLMVDAQGTVTQVNGETESIFGYLPAEIVGSAVELLLPASHRQDHRRHRADFAADPRPRAMGAGLELRALRKDGTEVPVDVSLGTIVTKTGTLTTAFVRDVSERAQAQRTALRLHDAEVRRRHALEINDSVIQGLATVFYALESGMTDSAQEALARTFEAARLMMDDLLDNNEATPLGPGDLIRASPAGVLRQDQLPEAPKPVEHGLQAIRVLVVDDAADLRLITRVGLESIGRMTVVGEAADGQEAIDKAELLQPDVVVLDLAMPVMDGLEALPLIKERAPKARIVVLSGFDDLRTRQAAMDLGAQAYVVKGTPTSEIIRVIRGLSPSWSSDQADVAARLPDDPFHVEPSGELDVDHLIHELRTPLTVIQGLASTLALRGDELPSATASELLHALFRNSKQMANLLDAVAAARSLHEGIALFAEDIALDGFLTEVISDLSPILEGRSVVVTSNISADYVASLDPLRIRQVVTNLVSNAVHFSPDDSSIEISLEQGECECRIVCRDHGPGVPSGRRHELFREHSRLGAEGRGMGLGLFISRGIALAHHGDLRYEDAAGGGGRFVLTLPIGVPVSPG